MRALMSTLAPAAAVILTGCGSLQNGSYELGQGVASYDALKAATDTCKAGGGALRPRATSDGRNLADYDCVIGKAR